MQSGFPFYVPSPLPLPSAGKILLMFQGADLPRRHKDESPVAMHARTLSVFMRRRRICSFSPLRNRRSLVVAPPPPRAHLSSLLVVAVFNGPLCSSLGSFPSTDRRRVPISGAIIEVCLADTNACIAILSFSFFCFPGPTSAHLASHKHPARHTYLLSVPLV